MSRSHAHTEALLTTQGKKRWEGVCHVAPNAVSGQLAATGPQRAQADGAWGGESTQGQTPTPSKKAAESGSMRTSQKHSLSGLQSLLSSFMSNSDPLFNINPQIWTLGKSQGHFHVLGWLPIGEQGLPTRDSAGKQAFKDRTLEPAENYMGPVCPAWHTRHKTYWTPRTAASVLRRSTLARRGSSQDEWRDRCLNFTAGPA